MIARLTHRGVNVFGRKIPVRYKDRFLQGNCLRSKVVIADNVNVTCVTTLGHVEGIIKLKKGIEYLEARTLYSATGFKYDLAKGFLYLTNNQRQHIKEAFR